MTLWTRGVFSTATRCSDCRPPIPSSAIAFVPLARSRSRNAGSTHARATTRAPTIGPTWVSKYPMMRSTVFASMMPFSVKISSRAPIRAVGLSVRACLQVALEQIDPNRRAGLGVVAPQLPAF